MIAAPILYLEIITDDPTLLLRGALKGPSGFPATAMSKHRLLRHCRHLHLEPHRLIMHDDPPSEHVRRLTRSHRRVMTQLTETFTAITTSHGFPVLFPNIETMTISAYTGARSSSFTTTWLEKPIPTSLRAAWEGLLYVNNARVRCNTASRQYPLHGHQLPRLMINHVAAERSVWTLDKDGRDDTSVIEPPIQYFHANSIGQTWLMWYNQPVVYLFTLRYDEKALSPAEMMLRLGKKGVELLLHARPHGRQAPNMQRRLDVEIQVSWDDIDLTGLGADVQENMVRCEMNKAMDLVDRWYDGTEYLRGGKTWRLQQPHDRWTMRVVPGSLHCPACQAPDESVRGYGEGHKQELTLSFVSGEGR